MAPNWLDLFFLLILGVVSLGSVCALDAVDRGYDVDAVVVEREDVCFVGRDEAVEAHHCAHLALKDIGTGEGFLGHLNSLRLENSQTLVQGDAVGPLGIRIVISVHNAFADSDDTSHATGSRTQLLTMDLVRMELLLKEIVGGEAIGWARSRPLDPDARVLLRAMMEPSDSNGHPKKLDDAAPPEFGISQLKRLFQEQQRYLDYFFKYLNYEEVLAFTHLCIATKGVIFFSGVGKSGFVAQKTAQTLVSIGMKAMFLSPTDALHGDIGLVGLDNVVVLFNKSGAMEELNKLIPCARGKGAYLVGISSLKNSNFREMCDLHVCLPLERELCPFDLAPVLSTAIQMLFGDTVAIALMQAKNMTREQYALNHPGGRIGKRFIFRVEDVMSKGEALPLCRESDFIMDQLVELTTKGCGCLIVVDKCKQLIATFTDGDLRRALNSSREGIFHIQVGEMCNSSLPKCALETDAGRKFDHPENSKLLVKLGSKDIATCASPRSEAEELWVLQNFQRKLVDSGAHHTLVSVVTVSTSGISSRMSETCVLRLVERLPTGIYADQYELQGIQRRGGLQNFPYNEAPGGLISHLLLQTRFMEAQIHGDVNLEQIALLSAQSILNVHVALLEVENDGKNGSASSLQARVTLPLHVRYPPLSVDSHSVVHIPVPHILVSCQNAKKDSKTLPAANQWKHVSLGNVGEPESWPGQDWNVLDWNVPAGNPADYSFVARFTAIAALSGVLVVFAASVAADYRN